jgi:small subunit ribosomal protein S3Ae
MTAGKNPRNFKKKGQQKKKVVHAFNKKEWYNIRAPALFEVRVPTLSPCNKAQGQNIPADSLKGRIFQITHADLNQQNKHDLAWRIVKLQVEEVKGYDCFTNFSGCSITRDKMCTLVKKWHNLIEAFVQAKTTDGYLVRVFSIAFTRRQNRQVKATCYAKASKVKQIRQKMQEIMVNECQKSSLKDLFKKILSDVISKQITDECNKIFPLQNVLVHKAKVLKKPKFDLTKLMELYAEDKTEASEATAVNKVEA